MTFDEFNRVFCKGIFKEALINVTNTFDKMSAQPAAANRIGISSGASTDVPIAIKINEYQRGQMLNGLDPKANHFKEGRQILNSLNKIREEEQGSLSHDNGGYKKFLDDPLGSKARAKEEMEKQKRKVDPFVERIKLIDDIEQAHQLRRPVAANSKDDLTTGRKLQQTARIEAKQKFYEENPQFKGVEDQQQKDKLKEAQQRRLRMEESREQVKIPLVYLEKTAEERLKDQNELLSRF